MGGGTAPTPLRRGYAPLHPCEDPFIVATAYCGSGALYPVLVLRTRLKRREAARGGSAGAPVVWSLFGERVVEGGWMKGLTDSEEM